MCIHSYEEVVRVGPNMMALASLQKKETGHSTDMQWVCKETEREHHVKTEDWSDARKSQGIQLPANTRS